MTNAPPKKRHWFQLHLSTCVVLLAFVSAVSGLWIRGGVWRLHIVLCENSSSRQVGALSGKGLYCAILRQDLTIGIYEPSTGRLVSILEDPFVPQSEKKTHGGASVPMRFKEMMPLMYFWDDSTLYIAPFVDGGYCEWESETGNCTIIHIKDRPEYKDPLYVVGSTRLEFVGNKAAISMRVRPDPWWGLAWPRSSGSRLAWGCFCV